MHLLSSDIDEVVASLPASFWGRFSGKRVLLTGGRGFLGRYFTEVFARVNQSFLLANDCAPVELVVLDNFISSGPFGEHAQAAPHVAFLKHDVIKPFYPERPVDFVLHAAGIASPEHYLKFPEETAEVSAIGTKNMIQIAKDNPGCRLAFFSSSEIYGNPDKDHVPTAETYKGYVSCTGPRSAYDEGKRFGEMLVRKAFERHDVQAVSIRPFNFYGPSQQRTDGRVLPNFAARWVDGQPLRVYGDGQQTRTFCYVTDGIRGCLQALVDGHAGEPYNVGNPNPEISMRDLALTVGRITGQDVRFEKAEYPETYPADEPQRRCPDISKIRSHVGYEPKVALEDGLRRFFGWADRAFRDVRAAA